VSKGGLPSDVAWGLFAPHPSVAEQLLTAARPSNLDQCGSRPFHCSTAKDSTTPIAASVGGEVLPLYSLAVWPSLWGLPAIASLLPPSHQLSSLEPLSLETPSLLPPYLLAASAQQEGNAGGQPTGGGGGVRSGVGDRMRAGVRAGNSTAHNYSTSLPSVTQARIEALEARYQALLASCVVEGVVAVAALLALCLCRRRGRAASHHLAHMRAMAHKQMVEIDGGTATDSGQGSSGAVEKIV